MDSYAKMEVSMGISSDANLNLQRDTRSSGGIAIMKYVLATVVCFCLGCRQPVRTHKLTTSVDDIWATQPRQSINYSVEWKQ
jgi:hypothetical protein